MGLIMGIVMGSIMGIVMGSIIVTAIPSIIVTAIPPNPDMTQKAPSPSVLSLEIQLE